MRNIYRIIIFLIIFVALLAAIIWNYEKRREHEELSEGTYSLSFLYEIPGITDEEIRAVEALREQYEFLILGSMLNTEAFYDENGVIKGFTVLLCDWLTQLFGIPVKPAIYEWDELLAGLESGDIAFTGELTATEERRETGYVMTDAIANRTIKLMRIADSIHLDSIAAVRPLRYAFLDGVITFSQVEQYAIAEFEPVFVSNYRGAYEMLKSGEVDAFIDEGDAEAAFDEYGDVFSEAFFPLIYSPVSLATRTGELAPIISVVQKVLESGGIQFLTEFYNIGEQEYIRHKLFTQLTREEREYLDNHFEISFAAEYDNYPVSFYNKREQQWQGIVFDVIDELEKLTGLTFVIVNDQDADWYILLDMLSRGEAVMISELIRTRERERRFLWPNTAINSDNYALISKSDYRYIKINEVLFARIGLIKDSAHTALFNQWFPNHMNTEEYDSFESVVDALSRGEIDMLMGSKNMLLALTHYQEFAGFKANIVFNHSFDSTFGFNRDEALLCAIIDKALRLIDTNAISERWIRRTYDYRLRLTEARLPWLIGSSVLLSFVLILVVVLFQRTRREGKRLDMLVSERTNELEFANRAKSGFLAVMSHEIRTPVSAIVGIAQIQLLKEDLPEEFAKALELIYNSGNSLIGIINDILDMSKIETGKLELAPIEYDIPNLINDTARLNIVRIGSKPIHFALDVDESLPLKLYGDELRLKQILNNLLTNAIKYTEKGYVKLSVSHFIQGEDVTLRFSVEDTGQGMKPEEQKRLFSAYLRLNTESNRLTEGTGLGLSITRRLVKMMGGAIAVKSEYGKGSVFTVTVMQKVIDCKSIGPELSEQLRNFTFLGDRQLGELQINREPMPYGKVLVVDDLTTNLYVTEGLLRPYGLSVETAESGYAAIEKVQSGKIYDVIFMDHMMPSMDGIQTTKLLRTDGYTGPIVALTANAIVGQSEIFRENGFDGFISKPIDIRKLNAVLNSMVRDKQSPEVLDEARKKKVDVVKPDIKANAELLEIFARDAEKVLPILETTLTTLLDIETAASGDLRLFTTSVHAMKGALANIGEKDCANLADVLEKAGKAEDRAVICAETQNFIDMLKAITARREAVAKHTDSDTDEDPAFLAEQLEIIRASCAEYDDITAKAALENLKKMSWKKETKDVLDKIDEYLLHSDFEKAETISADYLNQRP